ncbi:MAG: glutamate synthase subunit alpha, partial [Planctomycetes bacterium]|nr:glutamate synthase subunit alpha [Planctomycetota bacterium]
MKSFGLYRPEFEHDACGVGFLCRLDGEARHELVEQALTVLCNLTHRGAAADAGGGKESGDGAGILLRLSDDFFRRVAGTELPPAGRYGVGLAFLPLRAEAQARCRTLVEEASQQEGWRFLGWRMMPTRPDALGDVARAALPAIHQFFVTRMRDDPATDSDGAALERNLYILRKICAAAADAAGFGLEQFYIASLSARTMVYKGMMSAPQLAQFYPDLTNPDLVSSFAVVHQRYSTNTFPSWRLAQPFRCLAHNGEINTLRGNRSQMGAREPHLASPLFGKDVRKILPVIEPDGSDSASLDNALELLVQGDRQLPHALAMLLPQAWGAKYQMGADLRGFFEFHAGLMEPWDGPAAVVASDGLRVAAALDRNGLRPARYCVTYDGLVVFASEAGVLDLPPERIQTLSALRPGQMLVADPATGRLIT